MVKQSNWKQSRRAKKVRAKNFPDLISLQLVEESPFKTEHNFHNKFFLSDIVCVFQYHRHCTFVLYCCTFENKDITHLVADIAKETRTQGNSHNNIHLQAKDSCTGTLNNLLLIQKATEECECPLTRTV